MLSLCCYSLGNGTTYAFQKILRLATWSQVAITSTMKSILLRKSMLKIIPNFHLEYFAALQQSSGH